MKIVITIRNFDKIGKFESDILFQQVYKINKISFQQLMKSLNWYIINHTKKLT